MNFFQVQEQARRNTFFLVVLFTASVLLTIFLVYLVLGLMFQGADLKGGGSLGGLSQGLTLDLFWKVFLGVGLLIFAGSVVKYIALKSGGAVVAKALGGTLVPRATKDPEQRRLLNLVDEMAIASGVPVPQVYLLPGTSINAFAAGHDCNSAVIGVTQGIVRQLDRPELQGVIAHEFSHILNGDMRFNLRLTGLLNGIQMISHVGFFFLYSCTGGYSRGWRRRRSVEVEGSGRLIFLAIALLVIGAVGHFFGSLIRAAVSRQREYLADASAVQFTRNPQGIGLALQKVMLASGVLEHPRAVEYSHMYFSEGTASFGGVASFLGGLFATHPPLPDRIQRVLPDWRGHIEVKLKKELPDKPAATAPEKKAAARVRETAVQSVLMGAVVAATTGAAAPGKQEKVTGKQLIDSIGNASPEHCAAAHALLKNLPAPLQAATEDPNTARALCYALLLDRRDPEIKQRQMDQLESNADHGVFPEVIRLAPDMGRIRFTDRLPLVQLAIPSLRTISDAQYARFRANLGALVQADRKTAIFEWCLETLVCHYLAANFRTSPQQGSSQRLEALREDCAYALYILACAGSRGGGRERAFAAGAEALGMAIELPQEDFDETQLNKERLDRAMQNLARMAPRHKERFLRACVQCAQQDQRVEVTEAELLRVYAALLDCPMPPTILSGAVPVSAPAEKAGRTSSQEGSG